MAISPKSIKILWSASGGRCAFPGCWERLCYHEAGDSAPFTLGEMAHICGDKPGSNRHDPSQNDADRDDYQNLILLCPTHHSLIDRKENETAYPSELLHEIKSKHEARVLEVLNGEATLTKVDLARSILPYLEENRQSWLQYGPLSDLARSQPHNEAAHTVWLSERLSVIVPNNRKIAGLIGENRQIFDVDEQPVVAEFALHARSYEAWVNDEVPYSAVKRFPVAFEELIRGLADGGE